MQADAIMAAMDIARSFSDAISKSTLFPGFSDFCLRAFMCSRANSFCGQALELRLTGGPTHRGQNPDELLARARMPHGKTRGVARRDVQKVGGFCLWTVFVAVLRERACAYRRTTYDVNTFLRGLDPVGARRPMVR